MEKDGENNLEKSPEKYRSIIQSQGIDKYPTYNKKKAKLIGMVTSCVGTLF